MVQQSDQMRSSKQKLLCREQNKRQAQDEGSAANTANLLPAILAAATAALQHAQKEEQSRLIAIDVIEVSPPSLSQYLPENLTPACAHNYGAGEKVLVLGTLCPTLSTHTC